MKIVKIGAQQDSAFNFLNKTELLKLKTKAMRSGVWFKALQRIDRVLIDLTIKVADTVRSPKLAKSILSLARKLESVMESGFSRVCREIGLPLAQKLSIVAQKLGNTSAKSWATDSAFAIYLAAMHFSGSKIFGSN
jgi:hypothetical protein